MQKSLVALVSIIAGSHAIAPSLQASPTFLTLSCSVTSPCQYESSETLGYCVQSATISQTAEGAAMLSVRMSRNALENIWTNTFASERFELTKSETSTLVAFWNEGQHLANLTSINGGASFSGRLTLENYTFDALCIRQDY